MFWVSYLFQRFILILAVYLWASQLCLIFTSLLPEGRLPLWQHEDFSHYFLTAVRILGDGDSIYHPTFSESELATHSVSSGGIRVPTNPPLLALLLTSVGIIPLLPSWIAFQALSLASCLMAFAALIRRTNAEGSKWERRSLLLVIAVSNPMLSLVHYSQVQGFIVAALIMAALVVDARPRVAGALIGLTASLKIYTLPVLAFLYAARFYRIAIVAMLTALLAALAPLLIDPRLNYLDFSSHGMAEASRWAMSSSYNQSLTGLLRAIRYLTLYPLYVSDITAFQELTHQMGMALWLLSGIVLGLIVKKKIPLLRGLLFAVAVCVICAPLAWPHYYLLVWPYLICIWGGLSRWAKLTLWFSFPLWPVYLVTDASMKPSEIIANLESSPLVWLPGVIFITQFGMSAWRDVRGYLKSTR